MNANNRKFSVMVALALMAAAGAAYAAENSDPGPAAEYTNMGHSRADGKAMRLMSKAGSDVAATVPDGKGGYTRMGHSPGYAKAMRLMREGRRTDAEDAPAIEYTMMGHSAGDAKSMRKMTEPAKSVQVKE